MDSLVAPRANEPFPPRWRVNSRCVSKRRRPRAFTLVEVMVSMTILVLLLVVVSQMVNSTSNVTRISQLHVDADNAARAVFERMERDFNGMIRRPDLDCSIYPYCSEPGFKNAGSTPNDYLFFFCQTGAIKSAAGGPSSRATAVADAIAMVGYRVWEGGVGANSTPVKSTSDTPYYALERFAQSNALNIGSDRPLLFLCTGLNGGGTALLTPGYASNPKNVDQNSTLLKGTLFRLAHPYSDDASGCFHSLSDQVFRLEFALQMKQSWLDNYYLKTSGAAPNAPYWTSAKLPATSTPTPSDLAKVVLDMRDVASITVTMAILDTDSRRKIPGYNPLTPTGIYLTDMAQLCAALVDGDTPDVATIWADTLTKIGTSTETPQKNISAIARRVAAQNARIYQRTFYLK